MTSETEPSVGSSWDRIGDHIDVDGEPVRLQGFTSPQPQGVIVIGTRGSRLTLLVVPPQTSEASARRALADAAEPVDHGAAALADEERGAAGEQGQGLAERLVAVRGRVDIRTIE